METKNTKQIEKYFDWLWCFNSISGIYL